MHQNNLPTNIIFADVAAIDAWFSAPDSESSSDLHIDVVFGEARVGGEKGSKARFRLAMKRAEVVVILNETEPATIIKESVSRDDRNIRAQKTSKTKSSTSLAASAASGIDVNPASLSATAQVSAKAGTNVDTSDELTATEDFGPHKVRHSITHDGHYKWELWPAVGNILEGRPWSALDAPRFKIVDRRKEGTNRLPVTLTVEIRCLREDLEITDIELKDEAQWKSFLKSQFQKNKMAAAEAYIRNRLIEHGLMVTDTSEPFAPVTMAFRFVELT